MSSRGKALRIANFALAIGCVGLLISQWYRHAGLEAQRSAIRPSANELATSQREAAELNSRRVSDEELKRLRSDHDAIINLRAQLAMLEARARGRTEAALGAQIAPVSPEKPAEEGDVLRVDECRNVGSATLPATLQTALWAAAGGDTDSLGKLLVMEPSARADIQARLDAAPPSIRTSFPSPEAVVALFTASAIPLGSMKVLESRESQENGTGVLNVQLTGANGESRSVSLFGVKQAEGWRLYVPDSALVRYRALLQGAAKL